MRWLALKPDWHYNIHRTATLLEQVRGGRMLVGERMSHPVLTVKPDMPVQEALILMRKEHVSRFPVVDHRGHMVGLVSESDLMNASPSEATTLSVWEISYLLSKIMVERVMTKKVITVTEDMPLEDAARMMADHKIGCLPVMRENELVGIITETTLFKIFLELLGAREDGVRVTILVSDRPGMLNEITGAIQNIGGNIIALSTFLGESAENRLVVIKIGEASLEAVRKAIAPMAERVVDIREAKAV
jgi:acetoin utilization protein AcuB